MKLFGLFILSALLVHAGADTYLVSITLGADRLEPLQSDFDIVLELENTALIVIDGSELHNLSPYHSRVLDTDPVPGPYYLVYSPDPRFALDAYGEILLKDGNNYLLKITSGIVESLMHEQVRMRRLSLQPMLFRDPSPLPDVTFNQTVQDIVSLVDADTILASVQRLQDFISRYSTYDSCFAAATHIADLFTQYGCDTVYFQDHTYGHAPNVIGIKRGEVYDDSNYVIICGHFDATSYAQPAIAPGADDNASGTVGALEAARVLNNYDFEYEIRYIAFSGEEFGLYGSEYYAAQAAAQNDNILAVFNADMIAYADIAPEDMDVIAKNANPACGPLADFFIAVADTYTTLLTYKHMVNDMGYSDHAPFWDHGYLALLNIEDWWVNNPWYHTPGDTIGSGYNDHDLCTETIKAEIAAVATMAVPYETGIDEMTNGDLGTTMMTIMPTVSASRFSVQLNATRLSDAALEIFNLYGQRVTTLDLPREIGSPTTIVWDATGKDGKQLPAGVYIVKMRSGSVSQSEKIIILE
ncbi:MAG: M28 family peptidase [candidate division WOR-3 bacterium]|nr:MAG: M28 family peptidase [candidate division WOR-3 bacterium]